MACPIDECRFPVVDDLLTGFYEADFNFDGFLDLRLPGDFDQDGTPDVHRAFDTNGDGTPNTLHIELDGNVPVNLVGAPFQVPVNEGTVDQPDLIFNIDINLDGQSDRNIVLIPIETSDSGSDIADRTAAYMAHESQFGVTPETEDGGLLVVGGQIGLGLSVLPEDITVTQFELDPVDPDVSLREDVLISQSQFGGFLVDSPLELSGSPGVASKTTLEVAGPVVLAISPGGGTNTPDSPGGASSFDLSVNGQTIRFELDLDGNIDEPTATVIPYTFASTAEEIAASIVQAINTSTLGLTVRSIGREVLLDGVNVGDLVISDGTTLTSRQGTVADGEFVVISDGAQTVTFEFESAVNGNGGLQPNSQLVVFSPNGTADDVAASLAAAIRTSILQIDTVVDPDLPSRIVLSGDTPRVTVDTSNTPSVNESGVAGGAIPVFVKRSGSFTDAQVRDAILTAVNNTDVSTSLTATGRSADTLFIDQALNVSPEITNYFLSAVEDNEGNALKSNQLEDNVRFTILLEGAQFDYGDAPDPVENVPGRYPTLKEHNGARHLIVRDDNGDPFLALGQYLDADPDGRPQRNADGDDDSLIVLTDFPELFNVVDGPVGPIIQIPNVDQIPADQERSTITIDNGIDAITFEIDSDGMFDEDNLRVAFDPTGTFGDVTNSSDLAQNLAAAIGASGIDLSKIIVEGSSITLVADDDDGITIGSVAAPTGVLNLAGPTEITIDVTGTGVLDGWIDFNRDGDWDDPGERVFTNIPVEEGIPLVRQVSIPPTTPVTDTVEGLTTMARFRVSTEGTASPRGLALNGEVEDYELRIVGGTATTASQNYSTDEDNPTSFGALQGLLAGATERPGTELRVL